MELAHETLIAANAWIHRHGAAAEEQATRAWWEARQRRDHTGAAHWSSILQGIKQVRDLKDEIRHDP